MTDLIDEAVWYAVNTRHRQEVRAANNLTAWGVEIFIPWLRAGRVPGGGISSKKPFFPCYIFVRFNAARLLHQIRYTRGVLSVVGSLCGPIAVDDEIIRVCRVRTENCGEGPIRDELRRGDRVTITEGPLKDLEGIFEKHLPDGERIRILLTAVNYQARAAVPKYQVLRSGALTCDKAL